MRKSAAALLPVFVVAGALAVGHAQWLNYPTRGIPRTVDGKPDLTARAPRTADGHVDLTGVWTREGEIFRVVADPRNRALLTDWAKSLLSERQQNARSLIPTSKCLPSGIPPDMMRAAEPFKIIQTRDVVAILLQEFNNWRQIYTDGRPLPVDPQPVWFGYSVGRWERDAFIVESNGFNDKTWLDSGGTPHSDDLRMIERFKRPDVGHLEVEYTFTDRKAFSGPLSMNARFKLLPDTDLFDSHCENEKDSTHLR